MSARNTLAAKRRRREHRQGTKVRWQSHYVKTICRGCGHYRLMAVQADRCCVRCIRRAVVGLLSVPSYDQGGILPAGLMLAENAGEPEHIAVPA